MSRSSSGSSSHRSSQFDDAIKEVRSGVAIIEFVYKQIFSFS